MANVLSKVKERASRVTDDHRRKQAERKLNKLEKKLFQEQEEQARIEAEQRAIEAERNRLSQMSQQELLAETVMAIRGFYAEFQELKERQESLEDQIDRLETEIATLRSSSSVDDE